MKEASQSLRSVFSACRVHFFTGKGGVGKSSLVAATAHAAADAGKSPLIVELSHRKTMRLLFDADVHSKPTPVASGVHALSIDLEDALGDMMEARIGSRRPARLPVLRRFFRAAPAIAEILTLDILTRLESEQNAMGGPRWDPILVDLDATGHALMFLSLPDVFDGLAKSGPLRTMLDGFTALLGDPSRSRLHLVSLPRPLPVSETHELHASLLEKRAVQLGALFVNRVPPRLLSSEEAAELDALETRMPLEVALARRNVAASEQASRCVAQLEALRMPTVTIEDRVLHEVSSPAELAEAIAW